MADSALDRLAREADLGPAARGALDGLGDDRVARLLDAFEQARQARERELDRAVDDGLSLLPGPVRGMVKRVLF